MDKNNKNRTDLLAAGRKKLQQFRQKKDGGKVSKSTGKASKSDAASSVSKHSEPELESKQQIPVGEIPEARTAEASLATAEFTVQETVVGKEGSESTHGNENSVDALVSDVERIGPVLDNGMASVPSSEPSDILIIQGDSVDVGGLAPLDSVNAIDTVELTSAHGEDQESSFTVLEQVDGNKSMVLEGYIGPELAGFDEKAGVHAVSGQVDGRTVRETEPTSQPNGFSPQSLHISNAVNSEHVTQPREDSMAGTSSEGVAKLPPSSGYCATLENQDSLLSKDYSLIKSRDYGITSGGDESPYSLSQLAKLVQGLGEDEFQFVVMGRESASSFLSKTVDKLRLQGHGSSDILEGLEQQLYLTHFEKHMFHLQLSEQLEIQRELDYRFVQLVDELSAVNMSLKEVRVKKEYLADELSRCRSELELVACGKEDLQSELQRSKLELSNVVEELVDCRASVEALQVKSEGLNGNLTSQTKEIEKLEEEKGEIMLENEMLLMELVECKASLELSRLENHKSSEILALMTEERSKTEDERQSFVFANNNLLTELASCKDLLESLQVENANFNEDRSKLEEARENSVQETRKLTAELIGYKELVETLRTELSNLNGSLALVAEERNRLVEENGGLKAEKDNVVVELKNCKLSSTDLHVEYTKAVDDLKQAALRLEHLTVENATLTSSLDLFKAKLREVDSGQVGLLSEDGGSRIELSKMSNTEQESLIDEENSHHVIGKEDRTVISSSSEKTINSSFNHHKWDISNDSPEFITLMGRLDQVEEVIQNIEDTIERMYSHSASLIKSGGKTVSPGISKLIQAFESKAHTDDEESEEAPSIEIQPHSDAYMQTNEQIRHMREVLKELSLDAENASKLFKGERDGRMLSDTGLRELRVCHEALEERSNTLEEANIELVVLYEVIKQHLCTVEAKKGELLVLYEGSKQKDLSLQAKSTELERKLSAYESRIGELQVQFEELYRRSDDRASTINHNLGVFHNDVAERVLLLEKGLNATVFDVVDAIGKLDSTIGTSYPTLTGHSSGSLDIGTHVAASVEAATVLIKNLKENREAAPQEHESLLSSYKDLTEKFNDLHEKNVLYAEALNKIYGRIEKLIDDSCSGNEESQTESLDDKLLIPLDISKYDTLVERLAELLGDRLQLKSVNNKLSSELLDKAKDIEELRKRCLDSDIIQKMIGDIEGVIKLENVEISPAEPVSNLVSLIHFLIRNYEDQVSLSKEILVSKEMKMFELQGQIDHLYFLTISYENESLIFMESLRTAVEDFVAIQSETQRKVSELEQSELRVSSLREKLSIAVTKGKGLIVQRDGLKQSLASTSSELEKCMHDLQLKDARLHEMETKLKTYSEAGERVEALESELSYIRNSATALRESFLLKDSVLQRIEEILEDLELPEHFHARDIIEKVDWLARSVTGTSSLPTNDWDQKNSVGGASYSDSGFGVPGDDLRRKFDELQSKFYGLAEQNEMLEQSLMERNNLIQRWEDILDKINMPSQLRSMEPVDRIEWLRGALSEAHEHCDSLQQKIDNMESFCGTLTDDLEDSQRRLADVEAALKSVTKDREHLSDDLEDAQRRLAGMVAALNSVTRERENLSAIMENLSQDYEKVCGRATSFETENVKLLTEVSDLQEKLNEKLLNEENIHHVHSDIKRLQDLIREVLQDSDTEDLDLGANNTEYLERLIWKLTEKYTNISLNQKILGDAIEDQNMAVLKKELDEALGNLMRVTEERDRHAERNESLVREAEALEMRRRELQELLAQEEQKSASVKEKLNVAVRKGKSLVQQRDSLKKNINELTTEVERLKSVIELREHAIIEYEQKINSVEPEILSARNCLAETERELQEKRQTLSMMMSALAEIDFGFEPSIRDPVEKMEHIGKSWRDLHAAIASSQLDSSKSKRAAELLLAELNEVQERNDGLQEELSKSNMELLDLSKERDLEEAAKCEALSRLEHFSAVQSQERNKQFSELTVLKSVVDQLSADFSGINNLVTDVLPRDVELLHNLEASISSSLKSSDALSIADQAVGGVFSGPVSQSSENKVKLLPRESFSGYTKEEQSSDDTISQLWNFVAHHLQDFTIKVTALKEDLHIHSVSLHEQAMCLSETWGLLHREMVGQKLSFESINADIARLQSIEKERGAENLVLRRNISVLYEACKTSIMEIVKGKAMLAEDATIVENLRNNLGSSFSVNGGDLFTGQTLSFSEEYIRSMANGLLSVVKELHGLQGEIVEATQMEMKTTISNLQKEVREKDSQKDRICGELVSQIREAEATASSYMEELQLAKNQIHDLQGQVNVMEQLYNTLQQRIKDLEEQEAMSVALQEKARSLTDVLAAKKQEIEALTQALDEEKAQMEDMKNKVDERESLMLQKDLDLENAEASRGKALKKLSITVNKFDELHHLSATLLSEVEKLQSQVQERDAEISFLRQEVTRCTEDALLASKTSNKGNADELWDLVTWFDSLISGMGEHDVYLVDRKGNQVYDYKEKLQKQITIIVSELKDLKEVAQSRDNLLQLERNRVQELQRRGESLEESLREKESQLNLLHGLDNSGHQSTMDSETTEVEPVINKWAVQGTSVAPQVRSLRKVNNDQVAIAIDTDLDSGERLDDEDDDKAHGFKSLTTSKIVPRFTRPVSDLVDGLWVSCDRALMRQPALRLGVIIYWAVLHALLATFVV